MCGRSIVSSRVRSIGVATGLHSVEHLREAGADLAVEDLSDTTALRDWILAAD